MQPPASPAPSPEQVRLTDLVRRRRQLVDAAAQEKQREAILDQPLVTGSVERHLAFLSARCCLYMAAVVAIRCNPAIRPFYKRLREKGKPPKVAIVAAMRKLITTANAMLAHNRPWHADPA